MEDYQIRVVEEVDELNEKIIKLTSFIFSARFIDVVFEEQTRMQEQLFTMMHYSDLLRQRIAAFKIVN